MSISVNWQPIIGGILIAGGAIWAAVQAWRSQKTWRSGEVKPISRPTKADVHPAIPDAPAQRSADEGPPPGAQEWVVDIAAAMGDASAESKLTALRDGLTRDQARMSRIAELEARTV